MNRREFVGLTGAGVAGVIAEQRVKAAVAAQPAFAFAFGYIKALIAAVAAET